MKKWIRRLYAFDTLSAALLALLIFASPALARTSWFFTVENENGEVISSNVTATVFTANAQTTVAVYDDMKGPSRYGGSSHRPIIKST
jgi:hypothetical protein